MRVASCAWVWRRRRLAVLMFSPSALMDWRIGGGREPVLRDRFDIIEYISIFIGLNITYRYHILQAFDLRKTSGLVDVLLIGSVGFAKAMKALHPAQDRIGREINPVVMAAAELRKKAGEPFLREVLAGEKLFLIGDEDELGNLAGHQAPGKA